MDKISGAVMEGWVRYINAAPIYITSEEFPVSSVRKMVRALNNGDDAAIALDGPRGPRRIAKRGAYWVALNSNAQIRAVGVAVNHAFRLPRWDKHLIPFPRAKIAITVSEDLRPRLNDSRDALNDKVLESVISEMQEHSRQRLYSQGK